jgi:hypothetical protein
MAEPDCPVNIKARILKEKRLRKAKAEKQIVSRGCARGSYERIARAYNRTCSDQVGIKDIPAIFRIVRVALALTPECSDEDLDRLVAATVESYSKNWGRHDGF